MGRPSLVAQRREELLEAFYQCVLEYGFSGASMRKVAARAGRQTSAIHHYFTNRDEMIRELVQTYTRDLIDIFQEQIQMIRDPQARLAMGLEYIFSPDMINARTNGFFLECCAQARTHVAVRESLAHLFQQFRGVIVDQISQSPSLDHLSPKEREVTAAMVVALHEGMELQWFVDPSAVDLGAVCHRVKAWLFDFPTTPSPSTEKGGDHGLE
ncbi:MAG: TetR/AcrR family transcriptional regulator [Desulfobacterales bacterium]|nr:TetR/AcrR family transcriptional regulator [Desulfobacterales bacterium]